MANKNDNNYNCKLCSEEFEGQYSLKQHVKDIHGLSKKISYENLEVNEGGNVK